MTLTVRDYDQRMSDAANRLREALVERVTRGPGVATARSRQAAFDNAGVDARAKALVDKVARNAWKVTESDVAAVRAAGLSEDEIFELAVCAAVGQASRQRRAAMACLAGARAAEGQRASDGGASFAGARTGEGQRESEGRGGRR
jgi:hypothetical protein